MVQSKKKKYRHYSKGRLLKIRSQIAREHINRLMKTAIKLAQQGKISLAEKLADRARQFSRRYGVTISRQWKYFFCRHCKSFIFPGITARVRIRTTREPHIVIYCYKCKRHTRIPIKRKQIVANK